MDLERGWIGEDEADPGGVIRQPRRTWSKGGMERLKEEGTMDEDSFIKCSELGAAREGQSVVWVKSV
jgi:hypothetical protein